MLSEAKTHTNVRAILTSNKSLVLLSNKSIHKKMKLIFRVVRSSRSRIGWEIYWTVTRPGVTDFIFSFVNLISICHGECIFSETRITPSRNITREIREVRSAFMHLARFLPKFSLNSVFNQLISFHKRKTLSGVRGKVSRNGTQQKLLHKIIKILDKVDDFLVSFPLMSGS